MKYVLTMVDGIYQAPVPLDTWLDENDMVTGYDALCAWVRGRPFSGVVAVLSAAGTTAQWTSFLVDLPA